MLLGIFWIGMDMELSDLIFVLLYYSEGKIVGRTRIQKMIDLMRLDTKIPVKILYEPYRFGDFSDQLVKVLGILADNQFIEIPNEQYEQFQSSWKTAIICGINISSVI